MDPIEISYESMDVVPEAFRGLFTEQNGIAILTHVNGMKTQKDVFAVQDALRKEREDHARVREDLKLWKSLGPDAGEIQSKLDRFTELETAAGGKLDDVKLQQMVEARLGQKTAPLERQLKEVMTNFEMLKQENGNLVTSIERRDMSDSVRAIATEMKVVPTAIADVEMLAASYLERDPTTGEFIVKADAKGVTPGADVKTFMKEMQRLRPHWWPNSQGGGAGGAGAGGFGGDDNPWSSAGWNLTKQGQVVKEHGLAQAQAMAKAAGSGVGQTRPPRKK